MGMTLVTGPTLEPVLLDEAKAHLRVDISDDDGYISGLMLAARQWVEGQTHRALITQTWDFGYDYCWPREAQAKYRAWRLVLRLPVAPAASITSISYVDGTGATQTLATDQYQTILNNDHPRIEEAYNASWPDVRDQANAITVRAVVGYGSNPGDVPYPLRQAILLLAGHLYENREAVVIGQAPAEVPMSVEALISPYRRSVF